MALTNFITNLTTIWLTSQTRLTNPTVPTGFENTLRMRIRRRISGLSLEHPVCCGNLDARNTAHARN